ncbi:MAG: FtsX-like permease family protein [Bryobacteraceae bacterium]
MSAHLRLLRSFILRPLRQDRIRTLLIVISVALGVGVVIAIDRAGVAATGSFQSSLQTLVGKTDLEITAPGGVDETVLGRLAPLPRNVRFSPVIEATAVVPAIGAVTVFGVDPFTSGSQFRAEGDPAASSGPPFLALSAPLARRLHLKQRDTLALQFDGSPAHFRVGAVVKVSSDSSEFAIADIADLQQALRRFGRLDRIDVFVSKNEPFEAVERELRQALPETYALDRPGARSEENQRMLRAFRWNLRVLSYISLVVGAFLIYNTISISVVRRRAEIGVLRAVGASRGMVLGLFLAEALLLGLAGSLAGLLLGRFLAEGAVGLIGQTVNALYSSSQPAAIELTWPSALVAMFTGLAVSVLSALSPALDAMAITPTAAMARGGFQLEGRLAWKRRLAGALGLALLSLVASRGEAIDGKPVWGYAATFLAIASAALAAPAVVLAVHSITRNAVRRSLGVEGLLAARGLVASLPRTSVVVGALATAIAMMVSVGIMVGSFRETVLVWLDYQLRADLYIRAAGRPAAGQYPALPPEIGDTLRSVPGVAALDTFSGMEFRYGGVRATMAGQDMTVVRQHGRFRFLDGSHDEILASLPGHDRVIISEPFANKHHLRTGDSIELPVGDRRARFLIRGVYYEYSSEFGYVLMDRTTWTRYLPGRPATNLAVYLEPSADKEAVRREIQRRTARWKLFLADNRTLREGAVVIFDRTFAITYALEAVAILVAMLGAANSLLALVLDRRREIGMLRFLGAAPGQIRRMILVEAGFVGLLANLLGMALGFVLSLLLIHVINKQSFGWTIQFHPPYGLLAGAAVSILGATMLAALYPARVAARLNPIEVVHME